ncbi:MAG: hypothetical protein AB7S81_04765 [Bdellovibrionales bacterium]
MTKTTVEQEKTSKEPDRAKEIRTLFRTVGGDVTAKRKALDELSSSPDLLAQITKFKGNNFSPSFMTLLAQASIAEEDLYLRENIRRTIRKILRLQPHGDFTAVSRVAVQGMIETGDRELGARRVVEAQKLFSVLLDVNPAHSILHGGCIIGADAGSVRNIFTGHRGVVSLIPNPNNEASCGVAAARGLFVDNYMRWLKAKEDKTIRCSKDYESFCHCYADDKWMMVGFFRRYLEHAAENPNLFTENMAKSVIRLFNDSADQPGVHVTLRRNLKEVGTAMLPHVSDTTKLALKSQVVGAHLNRTPASRKNGSLKRIASL